MNEAIQLIPARVRQVIYVALTVVSLALTAAGALFQVSPYPTPWWVGGALAAVGILAAPFGILAATNVQPDTINSDAVVVQNDPDAEPKVLS